MIPIVVANVLLNLPVPTTEEVVKADATIIELATKEILSNPTFAERFIADLALGEMTVFQHYGANPTTLTKKQASEPAILLLHGSGGNQGVFLPLLQKLKEIDSKAPVFTLNYEADTDLRQLLAKIGEIQKLYEHVDVKHVTLHLVGYSRGAILAADYAFNPNHKIKGVEVKKVISVVGRLKNIDPITSTPYYAYSYDILNRVTQIWKNITDYSGSAKLYTLAAGEDWLVPSESVLVGKEKSTVPGFGHVLILYATDTKEQIIQWLFH